MKVLNKIISYLTFKKQLDQGEKPNFNLKMMHGMNRISILMFFIAIVAMVIRIIKGF